MTQITSIINNGDGTYTLEFSAPVTVPTTGNEGNWPLWSDTYGGLDSLIMPQTLVPTTTIVATAQDGETDFDTMYPIRQPLQLLAAEPFGVMAGEITIP